MDVSDIDGYNWNWSAKYEEEMASELADAYRTSFTQILPTLPRETVQQIASEWARVEAGEMIVRISDSTKERVRTIVAESVRDGRAISTTSKLIRDDFVFSRDRAKLVARTETARALGQGQKGAAIAQGRDEKLWINSGDDLVSEECEINGSAGWIAMADSFPSGVDTIPQHPNCRCVVTYRTQEVHDVDPYDYARGLKTHAEFRCEGCNRLLGKNVYSGTGIHCRHCKIERIA